MKTKFITILTLSYFVISAAFAQTKVYPSNDGPNSEFVKNKITRIEGVEMNAQTKSASIVSELLCPITDTDNEDNAGSGNPDYDMDVYLYQANSITPIEFNIFVDQDIINTVQLSLLSWDVDWNTLPNPADNERDAVYFNGHYLGFLSGANGQWSTTIFNVDPAWVNAGPSGKNLVRIDIDVNNTGSWAVTIDWGQLSINGGCAGLGVAEYRTVTIPKTEYLPCDIVAVSEEIDADPNLYVRAETNMLDPNGNIIAGISRYLTATMGDEPFTEDLSIPCSAVNGSYKIVTILYDGITNVQLDIEYLDFTVGAVCPEDVIKDNDPGECGAIVDYEVAGGSTQTAGLSSGSLFPIGTTTNTFINPDCSFTVTINDVEPPVPDEVALPDVVVECEVTLVPPIAIDNCGLINGTTVDPITYTEQGTYSVKWIYDDGNGNVVPQTQMVIVKDVTPPVINTILNRLWSPNHKYVHFELADLVTEVSDNCADLVIGDIKIVKVTSDEPEDKNGNGDGNTLLDMVISGDCSSLDLRSEREGSGNGRVYTIYLEVNDGNGNTGTAVCMVNVPHDKISITVDDGPVYEVMGNCSMEKSGIIANKPAEVQGYALTNYPNPFNRSTTIQFTIPNETRVMLKIYNIFGQEIETVVNQKYLSGTHIVKYDATGLPTGHYFYRLQTTDFSITKKMLFR